MPGASLVRACFWVRCWAGRGNCRARVFSKPCGFIGRLRTGGYGHGVCRDCSRADDQRVDDLRNYARLCSDRAADDFEPGEFFYSLAISEGTDLRSSCASGRDPSAERGITAARRESTRAASDAGRGGDTGCDYNPARCGSKNARERTERVASMLA